MKQILIENTHKMNVLVSAESIKGKIIDYGTRVSGIYLLINLYNNKFYVGSSVNVYHRIKDHFKRLNGNYHYNNHLQRSFNNHKENFIPILIEEVIDLNQLIAREQYWIDELDATNSKIGYNLSPTAGSTLGLKLSEETKQKMRLNRIGQKGHRFGKRLTQDHRDKISLSHKGLKHSLETRKKISEVQGVPVCQISLEGTFIKKWESAAMAQIDGFSKSCIGRCCKGERKTHAGFIWKYEVT